MPKQKISVSIELETVSKLLEKLASERKNFSSKSELIGHAVNEFLENKIAGNEKKKGGAA